MEKHIANYDKVYCDKKAIYNKVGQYLASKRNTDIKKEYPGDDLSYRTILKYVDVKKQLDKSTEKLQQKKIEEATKRKDLDDQWKDLLAKEQTLRQSFIDFDIFIQENGEKRERSMVKIKDNEHLRKEREEKNEAIREQIACLKATKEEMDKKISEYSIYQNFVHAAVDVFGYRSSDVLLQRYEALLAAKACLADNNQQRMKEIEGMKRTFSQKVENFINIMTGLNTDYSNMCERYKTSKFISSYWENVLGQAQDACKEKILETSKIRHNAWNLYLHICKFEKEEPTLSSDDMEGIFEKLKHSLTSFEAITRNAKTMGDEYVHTQNLRMNTV